MDDRRPDDLPPIQLNNDENNNYFRFGIEPVVAVVDNDVQLLGDGEYHTLASVPMASNDETINIVEEQKEAQKDKSSSDLDNEEVGNENCVSVEKDDFLNKNLKESVKEDENIMIWEDIRPKFSCTSCCYGIKKRYLLRHLKTHNRKNWNPEKINSDKEVEAREEEPLADVIKQCSKKYNVDDDDDGDKLRCSFACDECNYITNNRYLLVRHTRSHSGDKPYKCTICERGFTTGSSLRNHVNTHYGVKKNICKFCTTSFTTSGELNRHIKYKHTQEKPHKCNECDYTAVERSKLQRHMRYHTGERPYQCQDCSYASQDTSQLRRHMRTHTGEKPYKCEHCNVAYAKSTSLKLHKQGHNPSDGQMFKCELCPAQNARKSELRQHIQRMHYSHKPMICQRCGDIFSDRYSYKLHNKTHESEKCFKCQLCCYGTKKFSHLKTHMMIHTGERQSELDQTFILNSLYPRHQHHNKTYLLTEKSFICQKCKCEFPSEVRLTLHEGECSLRQGESTNSQE